MQRYSLFLILQTFGELFLQLFYTLILIALIICILDNGEIFAPLFPYYINIGIAQSLPHHALFLEVHEAREKDIILDVYMLKQAIHKLFELLEHQLIARTGILWGGKSIHQIADKFVARALIAMLAEHNADGVGYASAVHLLNSLLVH